MHPDCIEAVSRVLGRQLTQAEAQNIDARLVKAMRHLAAENRSLWAQQSHADKLTQAAERAAQDVAADAALKRRRVALTALHHNAIERLLATSPNDEIKTLRRMLAFHADGTNGTLSVENTANALRNEAIGQLLPVFDQLRGKVLGLFTNQEGVLDLTYALRGDARASAESKAAAKAFHEVTDRLRERFNRAGGAIGHLEDWSMPQSHSSHLVGRAGKEMWVADMMAAADRNRYVNPDGTLMTDAQLGDFLAHAWESIVTNGANKIHPGQSRGHGMRANRHRAHRQLHFKDADAYIAYQQKYSNTPMLQSLLNHIGTMARDVALVETLGPNPTAMMQYWMDTVQSRMAARDPVNAEKTASEIAKLQTLFDEVAGSHKPVVNSALAEAFDTYRSLNVASRLGSAAITTLSDLGTQAVTATYNGLPVTRVLMNELRSLNPASATDRRQALRAGLGVQQFIAAVNRWGTDGLAQDAQVSSAIARHAQGLASGVMKLSGMNAITGAGQQVYSLIQLLVARRAVHVDI